MSYEIKRPSCCAECARYLRDSKEPGCGHCDEWGGVQLHDGDVCHPNVGVKKKGGES